jgi:anti-sigma factor (TIGR02949 family)
MKPNCRRICDLLTEYADGALPDAQRAEVQRHLDACPPCRAIAGKECGARQLLRACAGRLRGAEPLPADLRSRCQAASRRAGATRVWSRPSVRFAIAAALLLILGTLVSIVTRHSDALLAAQLTADHVKCFGLLGLEDGKTMDSAAAQRMLEARFGLAVNVPSSSSAAGVDLVNARTCLYADGRIPHLMYEANGHDISLFVLEGETRAPAELDAFGHHTRIWSRGGNTFVMITPVPEQSVAKAAEYVSGEAR